jgi:hypothetical protein
MTNCPMHLDKIHCPSCMFIVKGECQHDKIMKLDNPKESIYTRLLRIENGRK